jgi:hypothetical protein
MTGTSLPLSSNQFQDEAGGANFTSRREPPVAVA